MGNDIIMVYGSNLSGHHGKGAALYAKLKFGAKQGQGVGLHGNSYGIPTKGRRTADGKYPILSLLEIQAGVLEFLVFTSKHPEMTFKVTRIACGLAGKKNEEIAPMFEGAPGNCVFDPEWAPFGFKSWTERP